MKTHTQIPVCLITDLPSWCGSWQRGSIMSSYRKYSVAATQKLYVRDEEFKAIPGVISNWDRTVTLLPDKSCIWAYIRNGDRWRGKEKGFVWRVIHVFSYQLKEGINSFQMKINSSNCGRNSTICVWLGKSNEAQNAGMQSISKAYFRYVKIVWKIVVDLIFSFLINIYIFKVLFTYDWSL